MAFDPHYSSLSFSNFHVPTINKDGNCLQMQYKDSFPFLDDNNNELFIKNYIMSSSSSSKTHFSEEFGVPGYESFQECDVSSHNYFSHPVYHAADYLMEGMKGFEDKYRPDYQPAATSGDNWESQEQQRRQKVEEVEAKVNRYSAEERREKILKYLKKRNQRNFTKTIKYACRKTLADRRVRVRGRFAKNSEMNEYEALPPKNNDAHPFEVDDNRYYYNSDGYFQMNMSDEEWLQEAIASLRCSPYPYTDEENNNAINGATFVNVQDFI